MGAEQQLIGAMSRAFVDFDRRSVLIPKRSTFVTAISGRRQASRPVSTWPLRWSRWILDARSPWLLLVVTLFSVFGRGGRDSFHLNWPSKVFVTDGFPNWPKGS